MARLVPRGDQGGIRSLAEARLPLLVIQGGGGLIEAAVLVFVPERAQTKPSGAARAALIERRDKGLFSVRDRADPIAAQSRWRPVRPAMNRKTISAFDLSTAPIRVMTSKSSTA